MEEVKIALKIIVGLSLLNVWLLQYNKPSRWRGGDAKTMMQEFDVYGLGSTLCYVIGFLKVGFSLALIGDTSLAYWRSVLPYKLVHKIQTKL